MAVVGPQPIEPAFEIVPEPGDLQDIKAWLRSKIAAQLRVHAADIDVNQPVTTYGLDSLSALELADSIETHFGVSLSLVNLLEGASVGQIAAELKSQTVPHETPSARDQSIDTYPLSHGQQSLWFLHRLSPESAAYNIAVAARITTSLNSGPTKRLSGINRTPRRATHDLQYPSRRRCPTCAPARRGSFPADRRISLDRVVTQRSTRVGSICSVRSGAWTTAALELVQACSRQSHPAAGRASHRLRFLVARHPPV